VADSCEYSDEAAGSGATELVTTDKKTVACLLTLQCL
jgi:hypothetical protein